MFNESLQHIRHSYKYISLFKSLKNYDIGLLLSPSHESTQIYVWYKVAAQYMFAEMYPFSYSTVPASVAINEY